MFHALLSNCKGRAVFSVACHTQPGNPIVSGKAQTPTYEAVWMHAEHDGRSDLITANFTLHRPVM